MCGSGTDREPRGAALVIAMLVMAVLLMAGTAFLTISSTESQIALNERVSAQAFPLAEAAIHQAIAKLNDNASLTELPRTALGGGTFGVAITTAAGCTATSARSLVATGTVPVAGGEAQVQLRVTLDRVSYPNSWALFAAVPSGLIDGRGKDGGKDRYDRHRGREDELRIGDNGVVDTFDSSLGAYGSTSESDRQQGGNVGANGGVTLDNNTVVWGNVSAGTTITAGFATIKGAKTPNASARSFPSATVVPPPPTGTLEVGEKNQTLGAGTYSYTSFRLGNNATLAINGGPVTIYVGGNMKLENNATLAINGGPVTIYVTGNVALENNVTLGGHPATQLQIIASDDLPDTQTDNIPRFTAGNGLTFHGGLYGKSTDIELGNNARIYGAMIARRIKVGNNARIHYDQALSDQKICHSGKFNIVRGTWREAMP